MSAAAFKLGPLTTYADPADMQAWLADARPGATLVYACGPMLADHPAKRLAADWAARDLVHLFSPRNAERSRCFDFLARKRDAGGESGRTQELACLPRSAGWAESSEGRIYAALCEAARRGWLCPTNEALAEALDLPSVRVAKYRFTKLVEARLIRVIEPARFGPRVIEITASGKRTQTPGDAQ